MGAFEDAFSDEPVKPDAEGADDKPESDDEVIDTPDKLEGRDSEPEKEPAGTSPAKETPAEPPKKEGEQPPAKVETVPHEALHATREKLKAAQAELAALRAGKEPPKQPTSVLDDEDKAFNERVAPIFQRMFRMSVNNAKRVPGREDYQEIYDFMNQEVAAHPELMSQINEADDPGEFLYQLGKSRKELAAVGGDVTKLRDHIRSEMTAQLSQKDQRIKALETELAALKTKKEKHEKVPASTNGEQSASNKEDGYSGPPPLKSVFG